MNGLAPSYIQDLCMPVTTVSTHTVQDDADHSAARRDLILLRTRRHISIPRHQSSHMEQFAL